MAFFAAMFCCNLLIPLAMVFGGFFMMKKPPKNRNSFAGYRTPRSKKSPEAWRFAQSCCGRLWWKIGLALLVPSILVQLPFAHAGEDTIGNMTLILEGIQLVVMFRTIHAVEKALKQTFD